MEPSPELEAYFNLCVNIYERKMADGTWEASISKIRAESEKFDSSPE
jgi:hypothetical protein